MRKVGDEVWFVNCTLHDKLIFYPGQIVAIGRIFYEVNYIAAYGEMAAQLLDHDRVYSTYRQAKQAALERVKHG